MFAECKFTRLGTSYSGHESQTVTNKTCQRWDTQTPHSHPYTDPDSFPDTTLDGAANKCRNPNAQSLGPWCFTTSTNTQWEYCDLPMCGEKHFMNSSKC